MTLPPKLRGKSLTFTLFRDGWALATNKVWIAKRTRHNCCASLVAALRSPAGRWTPTQVLSHRGTRVAPSEAVEVEGHIRLAVWEEFPGRESRSTGLVLSALTVTDAAVGYRFGPPRRVPPLYGNEAASEDVVARDNHLFLTDTRGDRVTEREISRSGGLGPRRHLVSRRILGPDAEALPRRGGSEIWVYSELVGERERLRITRRAAGASNLGAPQRVASSIESGWETAKSANGYVLLSVRTYDRALEVKDQSRISAAVIAPDGRLAPLQTAAFDPEVTGGSYDWAGAINGRGDQLIVSSNGGGGPATLWGSVATPRCRGYSPRFKLASSVGLFSASVATAGRHYAFFVAWPDTSGVVQLRRGRISCP